MKLHQILTLFAVLGGILLAPAARAEPAQHVEATLVAEHTAWLPGATNWVALRIKPEGGWHTYWRNPGDSGLPTTLQWTLPSNWKAGAIAWPYPSVHKLGDVTNYGYGEETLHLVPIEVPAKLNGPQTVQAKAKWLVCKDICIPGTAELSLTLPVAEIATADPAWSPRFAEARQRLPIPGLAGTFAVANNEVSLQLGELGSLAGATGAEIFPYANDLVKHSAAQRVALENNQVRITQEQSPYLTGTPQSVQGVVVIHSPQGSFAHEFTATPGTVAALPPAAVPAVAAEVETPPQQAPPTLLAVLGFALLGGLILNLMPCVFPVLSIKAVSVLEARRGDPAAERAHALAYTAGVVASCVGVAILLVVLRGSGEALGWGFQLQSPVFIALLAYLMLALGLSLSGLVQFGTQLMGVGQELVEQGGYAGSFFTGVLAVVVASPCTAPFMGTALGFAMTQPAAVALLVFATLGVGLALPFLLLGFFPALGAWLPRPGHWMETFKQVMAFPMYLTSVWLLWVLGRQLGLDAVTTALCGLVLVGFALWAWGSPPRGPVRIGAAALALAGALYLLPTSPGLPAPAGPAHGEPYSESRLAELRAQHRRVFVDFTADWCITCKVSEKVIFDNDRVRQAFEDQHVVVLTGDWTTEDPVITAALARFGRNGVPLYLVYPPDGGVPQVLPQILSPDIVIDAVTSPSSAPR